MTVATGRVSLCLYTVGFFWDNWWCSIILRFLQATLFLPWLLFCCISIISRFRNQSKVKTCRLNWYDASIERLQQRMSQYVALLRLFLYDNLWLAIRRKRWVVRLFCLMLAPWPRTVFNLCAGGNAGVELSFSYTFISLLLPGRNATAIINIGRFIGSVSVFGHDKCGRRSGLKAKYEVKEHHTFHRPQQLTSDCGQLFTGYWADVRQSVPINRHQTKRIWQKSVPSNAPHYLPNSPFRITKKGDAAFDSLPNVLHNIRGIRVA